MQTHAPRSAVAEELEWGKEGYMGRVAALAATPVDLVLAADVTYVDQDGVSPSTEHFVATCKCEARRDGRGSNPCMPALFPTA